MLAWQFMELVLPRAESIRRLPRRRRRSWHGQTASEPVVSSSNASSLAQIRVLVARIEQDVERSWASLRSEGRETPDE
jgi:hypothetical protein